MMDNLWAQYSLVLDCTQQCVWLLIKVRSPMTPHAGVVEFRVGVSCRQMRFEKDNTLPYPRVILQHYIVLQIIKKYSPIDHTSPPFKRPLRWHCLMWKWNTKEYCSGNNPQAFMLYASQKKVEYARSEWQCWALEEVHGQYWSPS
jgi:hypothetical protein